MKAAHCTVLLAVAVSLGVAGRAAATEKPAIVIGHTRGRDWGGPPPTVELRVFHDGRVELVISPDRRTLQSRLTPEAAAAFIRQASTDQMRTDLTTLNATFKPSCRKCEAMYVRFSDRQYRFATYLQARDASNKVTHLTVWENVRPDVASLVESADALAVVAFSGQYAGELRFLFRHSQIWPRCGNDSSIEPD